MFARSSGRGPQQLRLLVCKAYFATLASCIPRAVGEGAEADSEQGPRGTVERLFQERPETAGTGGARPLQRERDETPPPPDCLPAQNLSSSWQVEYQRLPGDEQRNRQNSHET